MLFLGLGHGHCLSIRTCLVLGLDDEVLGLGLSLVIKSLAFGWPNCQFVLEIVHKADSQVIDYAITNSCFSETHR